MTVPERRARPSRAGRRFDLRATAVAFALAAVGLIVAGWAVRMALDVAERRPAWAGVLVLAAVAAGLLWRRGRVRFSAARLARRTSAALEEATETALEALEAERTREAPGRVEETCADEIRAEGRGAEEMRVAGEEPTVVLPLDCQALTPDEFEQAIAGLCVRDGCAEVEVVGGAGDLGADVLAVAPDGRRLVIQCKRYSEENKVGSQDLQRFGGTCFTVHGADVAILVTSADFTAPALDYAEQCGILCVGDERLRAWSQGLAPAPWLSEPGLPGPPTDGEEGFSPSTVAP